MEAIVEKLEMVNGSKYVTLRCGKKEAMVIERSNSTMNVLCFNASHKAWGSSGNEFASVAKALEHYKSPEMKAMIECAVNSTFER